MADLSDVFESIMALNRWSGEESRSGPGSSLIYTHNLRRQLIEFCAQFPVRTIFDAPCGDFHWMREVAFPSGIQYIGGDIAPSLIEANLRRYAGPGRKFVKFDIVRDVFPQADLWFCRDCLFHLSNDNIFAALENFCRSNIPYVMTTTHFNTTGFANVDIADGEFRLLDLHSEPFALPRETLFRIADYIYPFPPREMCVFTREQVRAALNH